MDIGQNRYVAARACAAVDDSLFQEGHPPGLTLGDFMPVSGRRTNSKNKRTAMKEKKVARKNQRNYDAKQLFLVPFWMRHAPTAHSSRLALALDNASVTFQTAPSFKVAHLSPD